jgi:hypothetical protein
MFSSDWAIKIQPTRWGFQISANDNPARAPRVDLRVRQRNRFAASSAHLRSQARMVSRTPRLAGNTWRLRLSQITVYESKRSPWQ